MFNFPMQKPGELGVARQFVKSGQIGGTNYLGGTAPLTANGTTIFRLGGLCGRKAMAVRLGATAVTVPVSPGALTAKLVKYNAVTNAAVDLTQNLDLEALITREEAFVGLLAAVMDTPAAVIGPNDALEVHVVSDNATISPQPVGLVFTAEVFMLE